MDRAAGERDAAARRRHELRGRGSGALSRRRHGARLVQPFQRDGARALSVFAWKGGARRLTPAREAELVETLTDRLFPSTAAVIAHVARVWGIAYSKAGMITLLHRLGFEWRKPKGLPARADPAAQEAFVAAYERLLNGLAPDETVYFADAVHPEYQSRPAHGWVRRGEQLAVRRGPRAASG
jgi:transposase